MTRTEVLRKHSILGNIATCVFAQALAQAAVH